MNDVAALRVVALLETERLEGDSESFHLAQTCVAMSGKSLRR
jgi:hypothetical protein